MTPTLETHLLEDFDFDSLIRFTFVVWGIKDDFCVALCGPFPNFVRLAMQLLLQAPFQAAYSLHQFFSKVSLLKTPPRPLLLSKSSHIYPRDHENP
jgi:hypothetical protein